ncbi:hypothetical protein GCM10008106_27550 [Mongoliitalea lutea]|uniref:Uncharacterized protein n=1 Tax=Mongoliitalea lutea TaxID=849756 RepID=A0A8J3D0E5_9BACT|nr:hypothetical protein GCM10008106_27550 [Mongoliitalea lutea]
MKAFGRDLLINGFYKSLAWEGLDGTIAFQLMKNMKLPPPLKSEYEKYNEAKMLIRALGSKSCSQ